MSHLQGNRGLAMALFLLIFSLYLATYSARIESTDSLRVADATSSLVHFNDTLRDEAVWEETAQSFDTNLDYPFRNYDNSEALIVYVASLFFRLAELFPQIGLIHAMWLMNIVLVSLTAMAFFAYARLLGYSEQLAILGTLLFALGTIVWPYSKTLFREPLAMLMVLLVALALEKWRLNYRHIWWLALAILGLVAAFFSKNSTVFALPTFLIVAMPSMNRHRWGDALLGIACIILLVLAFVPNAFVSLGELLRPIRRFQLDYAQAALQGYLFSIGGSLWATSPVLLLGIGAFWQGKRRILYASLMMIVAYALGHAFLTDLHWFGGLSWPPRFLVPVVPFAALLILPSIEWLMQPKRRMWRILAVILAAFSIGMQVIASISWQDAYVNLLPVESGGLVEWAGGLYDPRYLRWLLLPQSWQAVSFDIAWTRSGAPYFIWIFLGISLVSAFIIWQRRYRWLVIVVALINVTVLYVGLQHLYRNDQQYWADKPALFDMLAILGVESENGEPLLMAGDANVTYERFVMNYNRLSSVRPVVLGFQWGEATSAEDSPEIPFRSNVTDLFAWDIPRVIDDLATHHERLWWLGHNSEFTPWAVRVEERYLVENYYLLQAYRSEDPLVRLFEFSTVRAPNPHDFRLPEKLSDLRFGEYIRLNGFTLPLGTEYSAGDVVPISFFWQTDAVLDTDYTISWFIVSSTGAYANLQGVDSQPKNGFALTTSWQANQFVIDNRARELPADLPAGEYLIWVRLYVTGSAGENALPITAGEAYQDNLGVLPIRLIVN